MNVIGFIIYRLEWNDEKLRMCRWLYKRFRKGLKAMNEIDIEVREFDEKKWVSHLAFVELTEAYDALKEEADQMRRNRFLTDVEMEELTRIRVEHTQMRERLNDLTVFMREHYSEEIGLGQHANMKDSVDAAMFYMGRERMIKKQRTEGMGDKLKGPWFGGE